MSEMCSKEWASIVFCVLAIKGNWLEKFLNIEHLKAIFSDKIFYFQRIFQNILGYFVVVYRGCTVCNNIATHNISYYW